MMKPIFIARQGRQPEGLLGHIVARIMARETRPENSYAIELLGLVSDDTLLEIGCGHGETLRRAVQQAGLVGCVGIDFSDVMLARARRRNRDLIWDCRLQLVQGNSKMLPFDDAQFSKILSVHTIYFWTDPAAHMAEALRVLKPGGRFVMCYCSTADSNAVASFPALVYHFPSVEKVEQTLSDLGFETPRTETTQLGSRLIHWTIANKPTNAAGKLCERLGPDHSMRNSPSRAA